MTTANFGLDTPNNGDFQDGWDQPVNNNTHRIDAILQYLYSAIAQAAGSQTNSSAPDFSIGALSPGSADALAKRLNAGLASDGSPLASSEVTFGRLSRLAGEQQALFDTLFSIEKAIRVASQGYEDSAPAERDRLLLAMKRAVSSPRGCVLGTGHSLSIDGTTTPVVSPPAGGLWMDLAGERRRLRKQQASTTGALAASEQVAFVYAKKDNTVLYSGSDGAFSKTGSIWDTMSSASNPSLADAQVGDIVKIASNVLYGYDLLGEYEIIAVAGATVTIRGGLPIPSTVATVAGLSFQIVDPYGVALFHDTAASSGGLYAEAAPTPALGVGELLDERAYLGEIHYSGAAMVAQYAYASKGMYDSGWVAAPALVAATPASVSAIQHSVGLGIGPLGTSGQQGWPLKARLFVAQKNASGMVYDVQELPLLSSLGGAAPNGEAGWFGYVNRTHAAFRYGAKLPVGADYAYQRKADAASFPNDPAVNASYQTTAANAAYRLIVSRH